MTETPVLTVFVESNQIRSEKRFDKSISVQDLVHNYQNTNTAQNGGFFNCNLATVQEPEFNLPALGDIAGLNIEKSRGVIYRPNCKPETYQAMIP
jgi:hypothetical protein